MAKPKPNKKSDASIQEVLAFLERYESENPGSKGTTYRHNSYSIRIRIVDPAFRGMDRVERDTHVRRWFDELSDDTIEQVTILLLLTEEELGKSFANMDFEDPIPSYF